MSGITSGSSVLNSAKHEIDKFLFDEPDAPPGVDGTSLPDPYAYVDREYEEEDPGCYNKCKDKYDKLRNKWGPPTLPNDEYTAIYESYQTTLQTLMTVSTLLMGFVITGAFINLSYSGDETFSQDHLVQFVDISMWAFGTALFSFALSLIVSLLGQQCYSTKSCFMDAVVFFKFFGFLLLFSELLIYACGHSMIGYVNFFMNINYVTPTTTLCPGNPWDLADAPGSYVAHSDSFCAQLGNDMYDAAKNNLTECKKTVKLIDEARPFNLGRKASETDRKLSVCNQLDWYTYEQQEWYEKKGVNVWFGWDAVKPVSLGWRGEPTDSDEETVAQNNGKILGEVMCHKTSTAEKVKLLCNEKKTDHSSDVLCAQAQSAYIEADKCSGQKFDDAMKCFHTCKVSGDTKDAMADKLYGLDIVLAKLQLGLVVWGIARGLLWLVFYFLTCWDLCHYYKRKYQANEKDADTINLYTDELQSGGLAPREVANLKVATMIVTEIEDKTPPRRAREVVVPAPVPAPPPRPIMTPQPSMSRIGVDLNHDGRADIYYVGADRNHDGIPDALQGASGLFPSTVGTTAAPSFSSAARIVVG